MIASRHYRIAVDLGKSMNIKFVFSRCGKSWHLTWVVESHGKCLKTTNLF